MNQILVTEKVYVTPELKRKKAIYKINFILSIIVIVILLSFYIHSEYAKNQEQEISEELLSGIVENTENVETTVNQNKDYNEVAQDDVWRVFIASTEKAQQNNDLAANQGTTKVTTAKITTNGKEYEYVGRIKIPKINVDFAILNPTDEQLVDWLKVSPCKFYGSNPNEVGNLCIAGHNYRNKKFFSKVPTLLVGDKIEITDLSNNTLTYVIYDKYTVDPEDIRCLDQVTNGKKIITLITCTNDSKQRIIVKAKELT